MSRGSGGGEGEASLETAAETAVNQCLALRPNESCAVVTDDERRAIGEALYDAASDLTADSVLACYPPGEQHGTEPPAPVAAAMRGPTSCSARRRRA